MVVTDLPAISETWVWQENARLPSMCTMQAPHNPVPQPNLVPVSFSPSRMTHSSGVSGGASVVAALPLTVKLVAIASSPERTLLTAAVHVRSGACRALFGICNSLHPRSGRGRGLHDHLLDNRTPL